MQECSRLFFFSVNFYVEPLDSLLFPVKIIFVLKVLLYLVVLQTGNHDLRQDDHSGPAHSGAAVHQHRWVSVLRVADAVGVSSH